MEYVGPPDDPHAHRSSFPVLFFEAGSHLNTDYIRSLEWLHCGANIMSDHGYEEPKTMADFVKEKYRWS